MNEEKKIIPKKAFDSEYSTEWLREIKFLTEKGIKYTFVHKVGEYGISRFKYKKTPALFAALVEFYSAIEAEIALKRKNEPVVSQADIKKAQEILERAVRQGVIKDPETKEETVITETVETKDDTE